MELKQLVKSFIPKAIRNRIHSVRKSGDMELFQLLPSAECDVTNLMPAQDMSLEDVFNSEKIYTCWKESKAELDQLNIPDGTGGVNPGDRRALYYLISHFKPAVVLEVGTHIGASTVHIASALSKASRANGKAASLTTLDIRDVNCTIEKPWLKYGTRYSPLQMLNSLNNRVRTKFVIGDSLQYLQDAKQKYDLIFLDGDHTASCVYQEIPLALKSLTKNGLLVLHDYYPEGKALWPMETAIYGPYMATERLKAEGAYVEIIPLRELPWPTKLGSHTTSLALLMKRS